MSKDNGNGSGSVGDGEAYEVGFGKPPKEHQFKPG